MSKEELLVLFAQHAELINLGSAEDAPSAEWIRKAEEELGISFPDEYVWFLNTFGGGDIGGEEIYSIYCIPFDEAVGGDIVYQNKIASNNIFNGRLVVSETDFGEEFHYNLNDPERLYITTGDHMEIYSSSFVEYLQKRLIAYIQS